MHATYASAVAAGLSPQGAKAIFRKSRLCDGEGVTNFSDDNVWVWCTDLDCVTTRCECHLIEAWTDKDGDHEEDRGYPGPGWRYWRKAKRFYACRCAPRPA